MRKLSIAVDEAESEHGSTNSISSPTTTTNDSSSSDPVSTVSLTPRSSATTPNHSREKLISNLDRYDSSEDEVAPTRSNKKNKKTRDNKKTKGVDDEEEVADEESDIESGGGADAPKSLPTTTSSGSGFRLSDLTSSRGVSTRRGGPASPRRTRRRLVTSASLESELKYEEAEFTFPGLKLCHGRCHCEIFFLGCFYQIPTAYVCARLDNRAALLLVVGVTVLQATIGTAMIGFIVPG